MATATVPSVRSSRMAPDSGDGSRFDRRLQIILQHATDVFYEKGYEGASMRDLSRSSGISLAGLYYYFENKERLLYLIQRHTFRTVIDRLREGLRDEEDPEQRIRTFIQNHLEYFLANRKAMAVLSREDDVLSGDYGAEIRGIKREYYRICLGLVDALQQPGAPKHKMDSRLAVMSLFGSLNWAYTWHDSRKDPGAEQMARAMGDMFLRGIMGCEVTEGRSPKRRAKR